MFPVSVARYVHKIYTNENWETKVLPTNFHVQMMGSFRCSFLAQFLFCPVFWRTHICYRASRRTSFPTAFFPSTWAPCSSSNFCLVLFTSHWVKRSVERKHAIFKLEFLPRVATELLPNGSSPTVTNTLSLWSLMKRTLSKSILEGKFDGLRTQWAQHNLEYHKTNASIWNWGEKHRSGTCAGGVFKKCFRLCQVAVDLD